MITEIKMNLQGMLSMRGAATSLRIQATMRDRENSPQYAIRADRRLIPDTTVRQASQAHAAQHDARQEAAHIFLLTFQRKPRLFRNLKSHNN